MGYHGALSPSWTSGSYWPPLFLMYRIPFWDHECSSNSKLSKPGLLESGIKCDLVASSSALLKKNFSHVEAGSALVPAELHWENSYSCFTHPVIDTMPVHQRVYSVPYASTKTRTKSKTDGLIWKKKKTSTKKARERQHGLAKTERKKNNNSHLTSS